MAGDRKRAVVIGGGECGDLPTLSGEFRQTDLIVAADSGADRLVEVGMAPDVLIGDLDSCSEETVLRLEKLGIPIMRLPREKDMTDLEAALEFCLAKGFADIDIYCALCDNRADHFLGNISLLIKHAVAGQRVFLRGDRNSFITVISPEQGKFMLVGSPGTTVSLIPMAGAAEGVTVKGLKYPLTEAQLTPGNTLGISNEMSDYLAEVEVRKGFLLIARGEDI